MADLATSYDWKDPNDKRRIAASLVNVVYQLEKGRETEEMVKEWCKLLKFEVYETITETIEGKEVLFGAVFKRVGDAGELEMPSEVVAFRSEFPQEIIQEAIAAAWNSMVNARQGSIVRRVEIGLQHLQRSIQRHEAHNIWIVGHSLGATIAIAVARNMKLNGQDRDKIDAHLFNPPFLYPRPHQVNLFKVLGKGLAAVRDILHSLGFGGLNIQMIDDEKLRGLYNEFIGVSGWMPNIYVEKNDPICCNYIRYFKKMGAIYNNNIKNRQPQLYERMKYYFCFVVAENITPSHMLPSAKLFVKDSRKAFATKENHCLRQWLLSGLTLEVQDICPPVESRVVQA